MDGTLNPDLWRRLKRLQGRVGKSAVILHFPNGSTRALTLSYKKKEMLLFRAFKRAGHLSALKDAREGRPETPLEESESRRSLSYERNALDDVLDLFAVATSIENPEAGYDNLPNLTFSILQSFKTEEREIGGEVKGGEGVL